MDVNVDLVYGQSFDGNGVLVAVVDSGLEIAHEDLTSNVVANGSWNFSNSTTDPTNTATDGDHGTSVAGLIAMAMNTIGGIGVAPAAQLKGFNFLGTQTILNNVASLGGSSENPKSDDVFAFNQSYGFGNTDDFSINSTVLSQYIYGVTTLRGGKGALYVKSSGNGFSSFGSAYCSYAVSSGLSCQNASFDPYNAIPYQIVVGATNASGIKSSYSTAGSALWVSAPGGEFGNNASVNSGGPSRLYAPAMVTTDQSNCSIGYSRTSSNRSAFNNGASPNTACNYANTFNGTSSAAPVTSGVIALVLEANPELTWRDVKHILAKTARQIDDSIAAVSVMLPDGSYIAEQAWTTNAAGNSFHNWYGFGMIDALAAVAMARDSYTLLDPFLDTGQFTSDTISLSIPDNSVTGASDTISVSSGPTTVEAVQITVSAAHSWTGDLAIELTSPSGTRSVVKNGRDGFGSSEDLTNMVLLSNAFYGETVTGNWTIKVVDLEAADVGTLTNWHIRVYGR
jgi:subtilisin family serine protease